MSHHDESAQLGKLYDHQLIQKLWPFMRPYKWRLVIITLASWTLVGCNVAWPMLFSHIAHVGQASGMGGEFGMLVLIFALVVLIGATADFISSYTADATSQRIVTDLRATLHERFLRLPLSFFDRIPNGKVLSRLQHDPDTLVNLLEVGFVTIVRNTLLLISVAVAMFVIDWRMALMAFAPVPIIVTMSIAYRPLMRKAFRNVRSRVSAMNARMEENIAGHSSVLVLNQEKRCAAELDEANADLRFWRIRAASLHALFPPWIHGAFGAGLALIIYQAGARYIAGEADVSRTLVSFIIYMGMFGWPLQEMMERLQMLQAAMAALERIFGFLEQEGDDLCAPASPSDSGYIPKADARGEIEFRDVWFAYREEEWVLKGMSFKAKPGERIAIAGPTGTGKTTILSLASALYRPQKGDILLDGKSLFELDPRYVRRQVATVIQDVFLFSDTIIENVRLWNTSISVDDVKRACERAHASGIIERLENGYEHKLGQRGGDLSAGQRQLISFARALAYDPPVLILDEATSAVDSETEENIRQGLGELTSGRTSLIVAHRFSTLADADRLLVIRDGCIAEETTDIRAFLKKKS